MTTFKLISKGSMRLSTQLQSNRLKGLRKLNEKPKRKEYPMILRRDVFNVKKMENKLAKFWVKISVHHVKGGIKVPIQVPRNQEHLFSLSVREKDTLKRKPLELAYNGDERGSA